MLPTLDARLAAAAELVRPGQPVADIGCDHGKLTAVLGSIVLAGVSAQTTWEILEKAPWVFTVGGPRIIMIPATRHSELRRWLWTHGFAFVADRPVQAAGRWYAVMAAEYTGERHEPTFSESPLGGTGSWPEGAGYAAWQKAKLPRMRLGVPDGTPLADEIDRLLKEETGL